jgi:3-hydroxybutyryl-CoA dehydrogenase
MKILVLGTPDRIGQLKQHAFAQLQPVWQPAGNNEDAGTIAGYELVVDLNLDEAPHRLATYADVKNLLVLGCAVKQTLGTMALRVAEAHRKAVQCKLYGMNALPGFLQNPGWEISTLLDEDMAGIADTFGFLGFGVQPVHDRIGMVGARVVCRIINEAFYMLQEGSAAEADIEQAMKLGVNYPYGPFEWARRIGLANVYDVLAGLRQELGADQYAICQLLQKRAQAERLAALP